MADNTQIRDERDRSRVSGSESYELSSLEEKLGKTGKKSGLQFGSWYDRTRVEEYLASK